MDCVICKSIEEKNKYRHVNPGETLHFIIDTIKDDTFAIIVRDNYCSYIWEICNYCPQCGRQLNKKEGEE